ncbi:hypothetical protein [Flavobacterium sp. 245]|uniref:hypothetical protein n=1 Tax=Flavobacterium sp. 245 TaxID=2512115 RepID=UPI00105DE20F|nr:hypothetical protein [Flavobacterium sp. 245]TDO94967.1 hypothetical protein EV145_11556 [Flavobacterium sp. 245]
MRYLKLMIPLIVFTSCKKDNISNNKNELIIEKQTKNESFHYKEFGKSLVENTDFPKEWEINTYQDTAKKIKKEYLDFQKKFNKLDYFDEKSGTKISNKSFFNSYIKNDSLLKLSKIESLSLLDSLVSNQKKIFYIKTSSVINSIAYEMPLVINKIDLALFNKKTFIKSINLYMEVDYPYSSKQNIGYLNENGILFYKKFRIDEDKTYYLGISKTNLNEYFNKK